MLLLGDGNWPERVFKIARTVVPILTAIVMAASVLV
jgi:hypothetical protein